MYSLPRVTELVRERISREFDHLGPEACVFEITESLKTDNPELLDMVSKCARDLGEPQKLMTGFSMFYRLLVAQATADLGQSTFNPLPRITADARDAIVLEIDRAGTEAFTTDAIDELERSNPELLQMAHYFASHQKDYLAVMQGFALMYKSLLVQSSEDRSLLH